MATENKVIDTQTLGDQISPQVRADDSRLIQIVVTSTGSARQWTGSTRVETCFGYMAVASHPGLRHTVFAGQHEPLNGNVSIISRSKIRPTEL